ncbi:MAG TPA: hypothetical protein VHN39_06500, partial [Phenylobacterium sp.]|nr:hypothetical protein [Phenylobacterium sp.]
MDVLQDAQHRHGVTGRVAGKFAGVEVADEGSGVARDQIVWVANHAEDSVLFFDITFAAQVAELAEAMPLIKTRVAMT